MKRALSLLLALLMAASLVMPQAWPPGSRSRSRTLSSSRRSPTPPNPTPGSPRRGSSLATPRG